MQEKNIINKSHTFFLYFKLDLLFRKYQSRAAIHMYWYTYHLNYQWDWSICLYKIWIHIQLMINKFIVKIIGCQQYRLKQFLTMFYSLINVTDWCLSPLKSSCSLHVLWKLTLYWTFIWNLNYITSVCYVNILGFIISTT